MVEGFEKITLREVIDFLYIACGIIDFYECGVVELLCDYIGIGVDVFAR